MSDEISLIDWRQLDLIRRECGGEAASIFADFIADADGLFAKLDDAVAKGDAVSAGKTAHQIKGSASTFGLARFAALAKEIEHDGAREGRTPAPETLARLRTLLAESAETLLRERPDMVQA